MRAIMAGAVCWGLGAMPLAAETVYLEPREGSPIAVAEVTFSDGMDYRIDWDDSKFGDYFLSMRPFKCLEGLEKLWCRVPYPYEIKRQISETDLTDLEYDLLFVWKPVNAYGIDMWNGVYYRLQWEDDGFSGVLHEMDLGELAVPPPAGELRPIDEKLLDEGDPESHWLPVVRIR